MRGAIRPECLCRPGRTPAVVAEVHDVTVAGPDFPNVVLTR
jgi:hypothetical protein